MGWLGIVRLNRGGMRVGERSAGTRGLVGERYLV